MKLHRIKQKPLSVNECWQGQRFRTPIYKCFSKKVPVLVNILRPKPIRPPEKTPLWTHYRWGVSNMMADTDNPTKPFQDVLFKNWRMKDHHIRFMILEKVKTKKGEEYIEFAVGTKDDLIEHLEYLISELKGES